LLAKAKTILPGRPRQVRTPLIPEELELALAYIMGEITANQGQQVMKQASRQSFHLWAQRVVCIAVRNGLLVLAKGNP